MFDESVWNWALIQRYHDEGHGFVECQRHFGFTHGAWNKAIKRGELVSKETPFRDRRRRYDWAEVQAYHDDGHSYLECLRKFGFTTAAWTKAVKRGELTPRPRTKSVEEVLSSSPRATGRNENSFAMESSSTSARDAGSRNG